MKRKLGGLSVQIKKTDKAMSEYVRAKTPYCVICGTRDRLTNGHLITRTARSVRFDLQNCETQCMSCNYTHEFRPEVFTSWYIKQYGLEKYEALVVRSKCIKKWTVDELKELEEHFKALKEGL